jgi:hypothetical protein
MRNSRFMITCEKGPRNAHGQDSVRFVVHERSSGKAVASFERLTAAHAWIERSDPTGNAGSNVMANQPVKRNSRPKP